MYYVCHAANLHTNIMDFRGFYSSTISILRAGIPRPTGNFPESLSQAILVGIMLVGRLGVHDRIDTPNRNTLDSTCVVTFNYVSLP